MRYAAFVLAVLVLLAAGVWYAMPEPYEAVALLRISSEEPSLFGARNARSAEGFGAMKRTQAQLMRSGVVLNRALNEPRIQSLELVQAHKDDAYAWLSSELSVDFPDDSELMRISLRGASREDLAEIVEAVVNKYLNEVVQRDREQRLEQQTRLEKAYVKQLNEYESELNALHNLRKVHRVSNSEADATKRQLARDELTQLQAERARLRQQISDNAMQILLAEARQDQAQGGPESADDRSNADRLNLPLLERQRTYLEELYEKASKSIARQAEEIERMTSYSSKVAAKEEEVQSTQRVVDQLRKALSDVRLEFAAPERVTKVDDVIVSRAIGDPVRRDMVLLGAAMLSLALVIVGLLLPRRRPT